VHVLTQAGFVALGSVAGGLLRWLIGVGVARWLGPAFPWGTFFINISSCVFLGWFLTVLQDRLAGGLAWISRDNLRLLVAVGFTGTYSTFSTFEYEAHVLLRDGADFKAAAYVFASVALGLLAVMLGVLLARW
jgi:fluoride exporter